MRDPKRIPQLLALVEEAWLLTPDLRLWQFLLMLQGSINVKHGCPKDTDLFYLEDNVMIDDLEEYVEAMKL